MYKLLTPLVLGTLAITTILATARLLLLPEAWVSSLVALLFLPLVIGGLLLRHRARTSTSGVAKVPGKLRATLVGAGVLLAAALLESMLEARGVISAEDGESAGGMFMVMLPAVVAIGIDFFSMWLEKRAAEDED